MEGERLAVLDQVIIPSATAIVVQMTNLKVALLWVIAKSLALTYPKRKMPPSAESGNSKNSRTLQKRPVIRDGRQV
jgi:hypothetical protein